jgi:iron complex outermembrane recepter protein
VLTQDFYDKEVSDSYEIGFKAQLLDRRLNVSGAVFYTRTRSAQQYRFDPIAFIQAVDGVDRVDNKGFELDVSGRPTDTLTLFGGFGYVDSKIKRLNADPTFEGNIFPYAAEYNATIGAQLDQPVTDTLKLLARGEYNLTGPIWWDVQNTPTTRRDSIGLMNVRLGLVHERWELTAWSRDLFDKEYASEAVVLLPFLNVLYKAPGRSFGIEGKIRF